jgi:hypothetical protein
VTKDFFICRHPTHLLQGWIKKHYSAGAKIGCASTIQSKNFVFCFVLSSACTTFADSIFADDEKTTCFQSSPFHTCLCGLLLQGGGPGRDKQPELPTLHHTRRTAADADRGPMAG